jgi:Ni,Fe-hydrogenase III component G
VETAEFRQAIEKAASGSLLEEGRLSELPCFTVKPAALIDAAVAWGDLPGAGVSWVEAILARDLGGELALTYVFRAHGGPRQVALRIRVLLPEGGVGHVPSLVERFPTAAIWETELADRFGLVFDGSKGSSPHGSGYVNRRPRKGGRS